MIAQPIPQKTSGFLCISSKFTTMKASLGLPLLAAALLLAGAQQQASATTYSWVNNSGSGTGTAPNGYWNSITHWNSGTVVPVSDVDTVISFTGISQNAVTTNDLGAMTLNRLVMQTSVGGTKALSIAGNSFNFVQNSSNVLPTLLLQNRGTSAITLSAPFTVTDALTITNSGTTTAGTTISGAITNTGGITFDGTGTNTITLGGGTMSGAGGLTHNGSYRINVTGTKSYTGSTTISNGTLGLGVNLTATSSVIVNGGTLTSSVANVNLGVGAVSMSTGGIDIRGAAAAGTFTLAANQAFTTTGGTLSFDLIDSISFDQVIGSGSGTFSLTDTTLALSGLTSIAGTYQLFTGFGGTNSVSGLTITGLDSGFTGSLDTTGLLTIAAIPEPSTYAMLAGVLALGMGVWRRTRGRSV
ncbi:MAG TPA: PEP-CTERM sorting domain-containing protein [Rariglobus sp.]